MSNPGGLDFNVTPYYDDYDEDKKFARILFRPGRAVQARELSQMQTIMQKQIERFGNYFFKDGTIVDGCEQGLDLNLPFVKLQSGYGGSEVDVDSFDGKDVYGALTGIKAKVGIVEDISGSDPKTLFVNYIGSGALVLTMNTTPTNLISGNTISTATGNGQVEFWDSTLKKVFVSNVLGTITSSQVATTYDANGSVVAMSVTNVADKRSSKEFENGEIVFTSDAENVRAYANTDAEFATTHVENGVTYTRGSKVTVGDGVLYVANHFVKNTNQTIILDKYKNTPSYKVGVVPTKSIVDHIADVSLVDNAQGTPNYQAPGADRFKIDTVLTKIALDEETSETEFISLIEVEDGAIKKRKTFGIDGKIEDIISKRTFEESGDYTLTNPKTSVREHLVQGNNGGRYTVSEGGNTNLLLLEVDPFIAYVKGYRNEFISKQSIELEKGLDVQYVDQNKTQINYGNYIEINDIVGPWNLMDSRKVDLYSTAFNALTNRSYSTGTSVNTANKIGEARVRSVEYLNNVQGTPTATYRLYLFDVVMNSGASFSSVRGVYDGSDALNKKFANVVLDSAGNAVLKESSFNAAIFQLPYVAIRSLRDIDNNVESGFTFKKEFDVSFNTSGIATISSGDNDETFVGTGLLSTTQKNENYIIMPTANVVTSVGVGTVSVTAGTAAVTGSGTTFLARINVGDYIQIGSEIHRVTVVNNNTSLTIANNHVAGATSVTAFKAFPAGSYINISGLGSNALQRAATVTIPGSTSITIELRETFATAFNAKVIATLNRSNAREMKKTLYANNQVYIQANTHPTGLSGPYSLGRSDVYKIRGIYQSSNFLAVPTTANTDVTALYTFDNGQRDNTYEHATIRPKVGVTPTGRLLVVFDYFSHDTSQGVSYLSVDSYPVDDVNETSTTINTSEIPVYTSTVSGLTYDLRNCLDFRLRKQDDTVNTLNPVDGGTYQVPVGGLHIPKPFSDFDADLSIYKGRVAKLFLNDKGEFGVVNGSPGYPTPTPPSSIPGTLDLAIVNIPPYPSVPTSVTIEPQKNRRYTMRDIGKIEDRVNRLEYYTSLNLLEKQAADTSILDDNGLDRFKNGILVDPFIGFNVADVNSADIKTSINRQEKFATAEIDLFQIAMSYNSTSSTGVTRTSGNKLVLGYTHEVFSSNPYTSSSLNLTQSLSYDWTGVMQVLPSTDNWMDTTNYPGKNLVVDLEGNADNWRQRSNAWETELDSWQTRWIGVPVQQEATVSKTTVGRVFDTSSQNQYDFISSSISVGPTEVQTQSRVVDVSVNHYMRAKDYVFSVTGLKPNSRLYAFIDSFDVTANCAQITLASGKTVNDVFNQINANGTVTPSASVYSTLATGTLYADSQGTINGILSLPAQTFSVGQREFKLIDDSQNRNSFATTSAKALILSQGLSLVATGSQINTRPININFASDVEKTSISKQVQTSGTAARNPLSQSFFIDDVNYPYGVFVTKIDLFFKTKSSVATRKVYVQLREMESGLPTRKAIGDATTYVENSAINTSVNGTSATTFTFSSPVYLLPGNEYCFSVIPEGNSDEYELWIAELGQTDISGTFNSPRIDKQPAAGVLFTSSNDYTWSVRQSQDVKYTIYVGNFSSVPSGTAVLQNLNYAVDIPFSAMIPNIATLKPVQTDVSLSARNVDNAGATTSYIDVDNLDLVRLTQRKYILDSAQETSVGVKSLTLRANMSTENKYITPVVDLERLQTIAYDFNINNQTSTAISGTAVFSAASNTVTGFGTAFTTEIDSGEYVLFGSEYRRVISVTNNAHLTVATNFVASGANVSMSVMNEEHPTGPYSSNSRYITRRVELADGFEANDLVVYLDVNRPAGTDIKVYYKVLNEEDNDAFDDKFYQEMPIEGNVIFNEDPNTYSAEKYIVPESIKSGGSNVLTGNVAISTSTTTVTGTSTRFMEQLRTGDIIRVNSDTRVVSSIANNTSLTVDSVFSTTSSGNLAYKLLYNSLVYTTPDNRTYSGYKYFAIKVVFLSSNQAIAPRIRKLRAIALT